MWTSLIFLAIGLFAIICTILKPAFYWESRKARQLRRPIGNTATSLLYIFIGLALVGIGIGDLLGIITL